MKNFTGSEVARPFIQGQQRCVAEFAGIRSTDLDKNYSTRNALEE